jgi:hypothetical protein
MLASVVSCATRAERYEERISRLREDVRQSFSPRFDPIWIAKEKKADKAGQELKRLIAVMDDALAELKTFDPPEKLLDLQRTHRDLFMACKQSLLQIQAEAGRERPDGMKAVHLYQEMTRTFLEMGDPR